MCSNHNKNHGCGQKKKQKALTLLYLASELLLKLRTQALSRPSSQQNRLFALHQKDNWEFFSTFSFHNKIVFGFALSLVKRRSPCDFAPKARDTAQSYLKWMPSNIGDHVVQTDGRTDGGTESHVTITYQNFLAWRFPNLLSKIIVLRWRYARGLCNEV